ncbi:MAG: PAS domain S-box protein [Coleofasciculus sp. S288]|nr:PAS domain S-box protein [Coleofasciculus sp. S288]
MPEFLKALLTSGGFIPHGHCYLWKPGLVWLHVVSDSLIALAYYSIPIMLVYFVGKRRDVPFDWIFLMFASFIISCGTTHLLEVWTLWHPTYWISGLIKAITAFVSLGTAVLLVPLIPKALALPSPAQLEATNLRLRNEITQRKLVEEALRTAHDELEIRVRERTAELTKINESLQVEIEQRKRAEESLRISEARFRLAVDNIPDVFVIYDAQRRLQFVNAEGLRRGEFSLEELLGYTDEEVLPPEIVNEYLPILQRAVETRTLQTGECTLTLPTIGTTTFIATYVPLLDERGEIYQILGITHDISDVYDELRLRKRAEEALQHINEELELRVEERTAELLQTNEQLLAEVIERHRVEVALRESEEKFRRIFNDAPIGIALARASDTQFIMVNPAFCKLMGYTDSELLALSCPAISYFEDLEKEQPYAELMLTGESHGYQMEKRYIKKNGEIIWGNLTTTAIRDSTDKVVYALGMVEEITERKQAQEALRQAHDELELRVQQRTAQLAKVNASLQDEITERKRTETALQNLVAGTAAVTGVEFFSALVQHLAAALEVRYAFVTESIDESISTARTLAFWAGDKLGKNFEYDIPNTPCEMVTNQRKMCCYSDSVQAIFPRDRDLVEMQAVCYLGVPLFDSSQKLIGLLCVLNDKPLVDEQRAQSIMSIFAARAAAELERKKAEEERQKSYNLLEAVIEGTPDAIFVKDLQGRYVMFNSAVVSVQGKPKSEILGRDDSELFGPETALPIMETDRRIVTTGNTEILEEDLLIGGTLRTYLSTKSVWRDAQDNVIGLIVIARDISDRKQVEREIRELNQNLERRVAERTAELEVTNKELEAFSYSVSHDLRAPLRAIDGFGQALLDRCADKLDDKGKHYLQRIRIGTQRMGELIDDLLKLSRVTRSEMHRTQVDLSALATEIVAELQQTQPERQVEWAIASGLVADGDVQLLRVVLENLLNNAWKFTSSKTLSHIEFNVLFQENTKPIYFVRDNGAGFDMAYIDKLFGAFQRLHSSTQFPGTGIGLATVQRIIHRHGGRIWAEGKVEQGAIFYFTL